MRSLGYIGSDGKYHRGAEKIMTHEENTMHKDWRQSYERKQFAREIIQPHVGSEPNPEFVKAYPEESKEYFNEEQIKQAERKLS